MGRIRTVKPELFTHGDLFDAEKEENLPLRISFIGLWCQCDRAGRFKWKPRELKLAIAPYDDCDFSRVLDALWTRGFLVKYEVEGETYGAVPSWSIHQFVNGKEAASKIPEPQENQYVDASSTREPRVKLAKVTGGVKEGKGKERKDLAQDEPASLFSQVKDTIFSAYRNKNGVDPEWNGREGKALSELLSANPTADLQHWRRCLNGWFQSETNHADRPGIWIPRLSSYRNPLNAYNRPKETAGTSKAEPISATESPSAIAFREAKRQMEAGQA